MNNRRSLLMAAVPTGAAIITASAPAGATASQSTVGVVPPAPGSEVPFTTFVPKVETLTATPFPPNLVGGASTGGLFGATNPNTWAKAKAALIRALADKAASDPILGWLKTFEPSFDSTAEAIVVKASQKLVPEVGQSAGQFVNSTLPYEPQLFEALLQSASTLMDRCLQYRKEMGSYEISGVKAALDYLVFIEQTPVQRNLLELSSQASLAEVATNSETSAANAFGKTLFPDAIARGLSFQSEGEALQASLSFNKENLKLSLSEKQFDLNVDAQLAQFTRYTTPGSASNYAERYIRLKKLLIEDLTDVYLKLFCASKGVKSVMDLEQISLSNGSTALVSIPVLQNNAAVISWVNALAGQNSSVTTPDVIDAFVFWTRSVLRTLERESQLDSEFNVAIPLTQPTGAQGKIILSDADLTKAFGKTTPTYQVSFSLDSSVLPFGDRLKSIRLIGVGLSAVHDPSDDIPFEYTSAFQVATSGAQAASVQTQNVNAASSYITPKLARFTALVETPGQTLGQGQTPYVRPPVFLSNVRLQGNFTGDSDPDMTVSLNCRNVDPLSGQWTISLDKNAVLWYNSKSQVPCWIAGLILYLRIRAKTA